MGMIADFEKRLKETSNGLLTGVIYKYTSPSNKIYIGQTTNEIKRRNSFRNSENYGGVKIDNARKKYRHDNFKYEVVLRKNYLNEEDATFDLDLLETYYIAEYDSYNNGYNSTFGGGGSMGYIVSEDTKQRLRKVRIGENNPFYGMHHTEEAKRKMKHNYNYNCNRKIGKNLSKESRENIRGKLKGIKRPNLYKAVVQIDKDTNEVIKQWDSIRQAALSCNFNECGISQCCRMRIKSSKGYVWRYIE